jgi:broad specificity phosphatase PhoE
VIQGVGRSTAACRLGDNQEVITRLVLIRHAQTDTDSRLCGSYDVQLSPAGQAQVRSVVRRPPTRPAPDALYTSTLARAMETAAALGRCWSLAPTAVDWAREIHCGEVEGLPLEDVRRRYADSWARNQAQDDDGFAWPGGESYCRFRARVLAGLETVATRHAGGRVAVVTHAGVISQVLGVIRARPASAWAVDRPGPFTATEVTWEGAAPASVLTFGEQDWY